MKPRKKPKDLLELNQNKNTLLIIDGNNLAYRSAAVLDLRNSKGENTSISFGMVQSVRRIIDRFKPLGVIICWDGGRSQFRLDLLPEYKSGKNRKSIRGHDKAELAPQFETVKTLFGLLGISQVQIKGVEADDLIAYLADGWVKTKLSDKGKDLVRAILVERNNRAIIVSSDHDFKQLVMLNNICQYNPITEQMLFEYNFNQLSKQGFMYPDQYRLFHIINGDKGDNIPGIPQIGEVKSTLFAKQFADWRKNYVQVVIKNKSHTLTAAELKVAEAILDNQDILRRNELLIDLRLFRVKSAMDLKYNLNRLDWFPELSPKRLLKEMGRLEFDTNISDFDKWLFPFSLLKAKKFSERIKECL